MYTSVYSTARITTLCMGLMLGLTSSAAFAGEISVKSGPNRAVLLELYTSEGCSSCPPADRWISALKAADLGTDKVVPLAFHVTYWDYIGWQDRFGNRAYDDRQRDIAAHNHSNTIYTPQFVFNGKDFQGVRRFVDELEEANKDIPNLSLAATVSKTPSADGIDRLKVAIESERLDSARRDLVLYVGVYENDLSTEVHRGENAGRDLRHDYVVRHLSGPIRHSKADKSLKTTAQIKIADSWNLAKGGFVVFAQDQRSGMVVQTISAEFRDQL